MNEVEVAAAALRGDPAATEVVVSRLACLPRFVAVCNQQLGGHLNPSELEDAAQDAAATVWRKLHEFRGDAAFTTWVFRVCDFTVRNAVRRQRSRRMAPLADAAEPPAPADAELQRLDAADEVQAALASLPPEVAAILRQRHFEGRDFPAIAETLGVPTNTVKTRYYRALAALRNRLRGMAES